MDSRVFDAIIGDISSLLADHGVTDCTSESLILLAEATRMEALDVIRRAHRHALYAGKTVVGSRDASRAFVEILESFSPPNSLAFQQSEHAMSRDINSFSLGTFPTDFTGLPLPNADQWSRR